MAIPVNKLFTSYETSSKLSSDGALLSKYGELKVSQIV